MIDKKASIATKLFSDWYHVDAKTREIYIEPNEENSFVVELEPRKDGKYHVTHYYETDTYKATDYVGDSTEEALVHALRAKLHQLQKQAYMYAEMIDALGYDELAEPNNDDR